MRPQSIVVLGGTGFLGTRLVARLIKDGHRVTVLSRDREQHKHLLVLPGLTLENCDVYVEAQLSERFRGKDVVINLVGILNERGFSGVGFAAHTLNSPKAYCGPPAPRALPDSCRSLP
jgi:NADH dehydrogenase